MAAVGSGAKRSAKTNATSAYGIVENFIGRMSSEEGSLTNGSDRSRRKRMRTVSWTIRTISRSLTSRFGREEAKEDGAGDRVAVWSWLMSRQRAIREAYSDTYPGTDLDTGQDTRVKRRSRTSDKRQATRDKRQESVDGFGLEIRAHGEEVDGWMDGCGREA